MTNHRIVKEILVWNEPDQAYDNIYVHADDCPACLDPLSPEPPVPPQHPEPDGSELFPFMWNQEGYFDWGLT